jgi:hypothetical protein
MMQDDSPTPEVTKDGMDVSTPGQADSRRLKQVKELVRELYTRSPFEPKNKVNRTASLSIRPNCAIWRS